MIDHDIKIYENDPYNDENLIAMTSYTNLVNKYSENNNSFLELGIGHGYTINFLLRNFANLTCIDAEDELIKKYKEKHKSIHFINSYFEEYDINLKYSNIGMGFILEHVKDPSLIIKKYSKKLDTDGRIFISVPNANSLHRIIANKAGILDDIKMLSGVDKRYGHLRFYTFNDWVKLFKECNMEIVASHGLFLKPFTTQQIASLNLSDKIYNALGETALDLPEISNAIFFVLKNKVDNE